MCNRRSFFALYIDPLWLGTLDRALVCFGHSEFFPRHCVPIHRGILDRALNLGAQMLSGETLSVHAAEQTVFDLMISIINSFSNRMALKGERSLIGIADHRIRRAIETMRHEIGEPLKRARLSQVACLSRPHFFCQFKKVTGLSPSLFLNTLRMERAAVMLMNEQKTLIDIAQELGFPGALHSPGFSASTKGLRPLNTAASHNYSASGEALPNENQTG